jgi:hypothetical protein
MHAQRWSVGEMRNKERRKERKKERNKEGEKEIFPQ